MYKTTNMIMKNPIYLLSKNNATAVMNFLYPKIAFPLSGKNNYATEINLKRKLLTSSFFE